MVKIEKYKLIYEYAYPVHDEQPAKQFLGLKDKTERVCIFCGRQSQDGATFKKNAHVIPAALGNTSLFNNEECDACNEHIFSIYENDLINYLQLERIFIRGRQRKGIPKYKPGKSNSYMESVKGSNTVSIIVDEQEKIFEVIEKENNTLLFRCNNISSYSPLGISKAIFHMGWSVLSNSKRKNFSNFYKWLNNEIDSFPIYLDVAYIPGGGLKNVILEVLEAEDIGDNDYPFIFRLTYGHKILSLYVPKNFEKASFPERLFSYKNIPANVEVKCDAYTIISNEKIKPDYLEFTIKYNEIEKFYKKLEDENE